MNSTIPGHFKHLVKNGNVFGSAVGVLFSRSSSDDCCFELSLNTNTQVGEESRNKERNECSEWAEKKSIHKSPESGRACADPFALTSILSLRRQALIVTFPFSRCTCARESASAASQHQQAVFHRGVTEAREIRARIRPKQPR